MNNNKNYRRKLSAICTWACILAVLSVLAVCALTYFFPEYFIYSAAGCIGAFGLLFALITVRLHVKYKKKEHGITKGPMLGTVMYDKINSLNEPALICDSLGKILWYNKFAQSCSGQRSPILGAYVSSFFTADLSNELSEEDTVFAGRNYQIEKTKIKSGEQTYFLLVLRDITKTVELEKYIRDNDKVVAYIMVDNLEELLQFEQEKYRDAAAGVEDLLRAWAAGVGGIIKEYEKDKYLFVFRVQDLDKFIDDGFDILDRVREIRIGSGNLPVTISIGVASVEGSLSDKEKAAHNALDMALQRGGDQAVVKIGEDTEFFGGRTNAAHKRTKVRARVVATELINHICNASNVIIMAHKFPDYDAFGASVGIARLVMHCGVKLNVVTNLKDKNVERCLKFFKDDEDYKGVFVDSAQGLDLVRSETLLIIVDVNNINMFESSDIANNVDKIVIVDHHRKTAEFEREPLISYIEPSSSSASELVSEMLEQVLPQSVLKRNEANMLLSGISLDTKQFTKTTGTKTYAAAMYLKDNGASYEEIQELFKTSLRDYKQEAHFGEKIEMYRNCMAIALNPFGNDQTDRILAARVADNLLMVEGVAASFALVLIGGTVHVSARSNGTINVQLILEELNGGGRFDAAGAQVQDENIGAVLLKLKHAIDNYIDPEV